MKTFPLDWHIVAGLSPAFTRAKRLSTSARAKGCQTSRTLLIRPGDSLPLSLKGTGETDNSRSSTPFLLLNWLLAMPASFGSALMSHLHTQPIHEVHEELLYATPQDMEVDILINKQQRPTFTFQNFYSRV
jgi:hypothetical protein